MLEVTELGKAQLVRGQMVPKFFLKEKRSQRRRVITSFEQLASGQGKKRCKAVTTSCSTAWRGIGREKKAGIASQAHLDLLSNCISMKCHFLLAHRCSQLCLLPEHSIPPQRGGCAGPFIELLPGWREQFSFLPYFLPASIPCAAPPVKLLGKAGTGGSARWVFVSGTVNRWGEISSPARI